MTEGGEGAGQTVIDCPPQCTGVFRAGTQLTLEATPAAGSIFTGWSGDCEGPGTCRLAMDGNRLARPRFERPSVQAAPRLAAGGGHTCLLRSDGTVACWGANWSGQLGTESRAAASTPSAVIGITTATAIAAGGDHACALLAHPPTQRRACRRRHPYAEAAPSRPRATRRSDTVPLPPARPPAPALSAVEGAKNERAYHPQATTPTAPHDARTPMATNPRGPRPPPGSAPRSQPERNPRRADTHPRKMKTTPIAP